MEDKIKEKLLKEIEELEKDESLLEAVIVKNELQQHEETKKAMTEEFLKKIASVEKSLLNWCYPVDEEIIKPLFEKLKQSIQGE